MNATPLPDGFGLRPLRADDTPDIFTAIDTQREHLGRWLPFVAATHRVEQTREVVAAMLADPANPVSGMPSRGLSGSNRRTVAPAPSRSATGFAPNTRDGDS